MNQDLLVDLEARLRSTLGCWHHYRLRVWQSCRSFDAASIDDRIKIAEEVLGAPHRGEVIWAWGGFVLLLSEVQNKLDDPDPHVRQDAAFVLVADFGHHARDAVPMLLDRLRSSKCTIHDKNLAAWALPRIGADGKHVVPVVAVLSKATNQFEAGELRRCLAETVESLTDSFRVLVPLARRCLRDPHWRCRLHGLVLVDRLGERDRRLLPMLVQNVKPLLADEVEEIRAVAQRIMDGQSKRVSQSS